MTQQRREQVTVDAGSFDLHLWLPPSGRGPGVLLIQEIFGVGPYIRDVAERLAAAGYVVGAPDVFWRFHPNYVAEHTPEGIQASIEKAGQLDPQHAVSDCVAALRRLGEVPEVDDRPGVLGFCLGGTLAFGVAAAGDPRCCVSYYGSNVPQMLDLVPEIRCPTLLIFGDQDPYIPFEGVADVRDELADDPRFIVHIEHAGHAFDNHKAPMFYNEAAADAAWAQTSAFLAEHLPTASGAAS
ncbi:MAG: dienelactone hydrolase family protein [Myxococcales bacterium]|nr:dienelactone hydrolase family protein [Myxococcales bacterium]